MRLRCADTGILQLALVGSLLIFQVSLLLKLERMIKTDPAQFDWTNEHTHWKDECKAAQQDLNAARLLLAEHKNVLPKISSSAAAIIEHLDRHTVDIKLQSQSQSPIVTKTMQEDKSGGAAISASPQPQNISEIRSQLDSAWGTRARVKAYNQQYRLYCWVPYALPLAILRNEATATKYADGFKQRVGEILETWGKRCDKTEIFIDDATKEFLGKGTNLDVLQTVHNIQTIIGANFSSVPTRGKSTDDNAWGFTWRVWLWIRQHRVVDFEWFIRAPPTSYIIPENILWYILRQQWSPTDAHYFGHKLYFRGEPTISAGVYGLSRSATLALGNAVEHMPTSKDGKFGGKCEEYVGGAVEQALATCMADAGGVKPEALRDSFEREMVLLFQMPAHFFHMNRSKGEGWYWKGKPEKIPQLRECCSSRLISIDNIFPLEESPGVIRQIQTALYNPRRNTQFAAQVLGAQNIGESEKKYFMDYLKEVKHNLQHVDDLISTLGN